MNLDLICSCDLDDQELTKATNEVLIHVAPWKGCLLNTAVPLVSPKVNTRQANHV